MSGPGPTMVYMNDAIGITGQQDELFESVAGITTCTGKCRP